jgi:hypothetical protein
MSATTTTLNQPVIIDDSTQPEAIVSDYNGPLVVVAGKGGLNLQAGASSVGGSVVVEGGDNKIAGGPTVASRNGENGGLQGNWFVQTKGGANDVWLATGNDVVMLGGTDTIHAAASNALIEGTGRGTTIDVFVGPGNITVFGGATKGDYIQANGLPTGTDELVGGSGGYNTITAGAGTTTLAGAGRDNLLVAAGADTIRPGNGNDTVSFSILNTSTLQPKDLITDWNKSDTLLLSGYDPTKDIWSKTSLGSVLSLSDGTQITFLNVDPSKVHIVNS